MARGVKSSISSAVAVVKEALGNGDFVVVELTKDGPKPVYDGDGQLLMFKDGGEASRHAASMSTPGRKFQPRRVKDDKWMDRERKRFFSKEYQTLPWAETVWWRNHEHVHGLHFPHVSVKNSVGLMAYTEDESKGSADVQTPIKPGKYLERYFSSILDAYIIRDLCTQFSNKFEDNCLIFGDTEDEFERLYTEGPSSCMSHGIDKYASHIHPVRVYAAGDLKLAYMKRDGRIVARTLVFPEKKVYSRVYGDGGRIEPLLKKEGYRKGPPVGAKLQRVIAWQDKVNKTGNQAFVLPHIDDISWVMDEGTHLKVGDPNVVKPNGALAFSGANGLSEWVFLRCQCCGKDAEKAVMTEVMVDYDGNRRRYCQACVDNPKVVGRCAASKKLVIRQQLVEMANGDLWWHRHFDDNGFTCQGNEKRYPVKERLIISDGSKSRRTKYVSKEFFAAQGGISCKTCGAKVLKECSTACSDRYKEEQKQYAQYQGKQGLGIGAATQWVSVDATATSGAWNEAPRRVR